jgi:putative transposase
MSRPLRIQFPGAIYHITCRGNNKQDIFLREEDAELFLEIVAKAVIRYGIMIHAYCLMINHYHFLIETPQGNISEPMRYINQRYTQFFNKRYTRVGHVFQGRYKSRLIEKDAHLLEVSRYIVNNPVHAGLVKATGEYAWSSYRQTAGLATPEEWLTVSWIHEQFDGCTDKAVNRYSAFVHEHREYCG